MDNPRAKGGAEKARLKWALQFKAAANDPKQKKLNFEKKILSSNKY